MNDFVLHILLNHSITLAAVIAFFRFKKIGQSFHPFVFFIWLGFANETLSLILIYTIRSNAVNSNVYVLIEYIMILWQFYKWNNSAIRNYYFFAALGLVIWIADNLIINTIDGNNSLFRITYSFITVFFSIDQINKLIIYDRGGLIRSAAFQICIAFLIYYSCKTFVEVFNAFHLNISDVFSRRVFMPLYFINLLSNIIYAIAVLCIPSKREFTWRY